MTVNIWKTHLWTVDKYVNMKAIFAEMSTTLTVVKIRPEKKKFRPVRDMNPWPLRYRSSDLPTVDHSRSSCNSARVLWAVLFTKCIIIIKKRQDNLQFSYFDFGLSAWFKFIFRVLMYLVCPYRLMQCLNAMPQKYGNQSICVSAYVFT